MLTSLDKSVSEKVGCRLCLLLAISRQLSALSFTNSDAISL